VATVFSHTASPRLRYLLHFLADYYGHPFHMVTDAEAFAASPGPRIGYSADVAENVVQVVPHGLLSASCTSPVDTRIFQHVAGFPAFFETGGPINFDLFSAIFWLITRYEEYGPHAKDAYGRYAVENSLAVRAGFLKIPLVHIWLEAFRGVLVAADPSFPTATPPFSFEPTYDIDMAWSFRGKGVWRNAGGLLRSLAGGRIADAKHRLRVLRGAVDDPFDCFGLLDRLHGRHGLQPHYFFHVGTKRNRYDKSLPLHLPAMQKLVRDTGTKAAIGLHPSWHSGDEPMALLQEKKALEEAAGRSIDASRQHYIRFTLPVTFRRLLDAGIRHDYSMGYGSRNGFRASVAVPYKWYDLEREEETELVLHPFCFMDANALYEQKMTPAEALAEMSRYREELRRTGGTMITIWHNSFLGTDPYFEGWREAWEEALSGFHAK
jgi:hypothetical protein